MLADDCDFGGTRAKRGVFLSYRQARTLQVTLTLSLTLTLALPLPLSPLINQFIKFTGSTWPRAGWSTWPR